MNQCDHLKPSKQVSHWSYEGGSVHEIGPFLGREWLNDSSGQKKRRFSGRGEGRQKRDTPKGCLYIV